MFGKNFGGNSDLPCAAEVKEAVGGAAEAKTRAVKIVINAKKETLDLGATIPEGESFEKDFEQIQASVEDAVPCIVLVRLDGHEGAGANDWALIGWNPEDVPVKLRMLQASSQSGVKKSFDGLNFKVYSATEKDELTWKTFAEQTKELSRDERREAMSRHEREAEDIKEEQKQIQMAAPKKLAGLVSLRINAHDSFKDSVKTCAAASDKAVVARLCGDKDEDLSGEILEGVNCVSSLQGKLPENDPVYVLLKAHDSFLLLSWLPDNCAPKPRMKLSTFKASVVDLVRELTGQDNILQGEVGCEEWLTDDVGKPSERGAADPAAAAAKKPGGYGGPMAGAVKMPGMPAGGFALPGVKRIE